MADRAVSITAFRADPSWVVDSLDIGPVTITRTGRPVAVLLSVEDYEAVVALARKYGGLREAVDAVVAEAQGDGGRG